MSTTPVAVVVGLYHGDPAALNADGGRIRRSAEQLDGHVRVGGAVSVLAGDDPMTWGIIVEFPDAVAAATWFDSADLWHPNTVDGRTQLWWLIEPPLPIAD